MEKIFPFLDGVTALANGKLVHKQQVRYELLPVGLDDDLVKLVVSNIHLSLKAFLNDQSELRGLAFLTLKHNQSLPSYRTGRTPLKPVCYPF
jgi:hypothetical protein